MESLSDEGFVQGVYYLKNKYYLQFEQFDVWEKQWSSSSDFQPCKEEFIKNWGTNAGNCCINAALFVSLVSRCIIYLLHFILSTFSSKKGKIDFFKKTEFWDLPEHWGWLLQWPLTRWYCRTSYFNSFYIGFALAHCVGLQQNSTCKILLAWSFAHIRPFEPLLL